MKKAQYIIMLLACLSTLTATARRPHKMKKAQLLELKQTIERLDERLPVPRFLANGTAATDYCASILRLTDGQYAADTAAVVQFFAGMKTLISQYEQVTPEDAAKYDLQGWHATLYERLYTTQQRFAPLRKYCDQRLEARRKALACTMPRGRLLRFCYEEWGSSRPNPTSLSIEPNQEGRPVITFSIGSRCQEEGGLRQQVPATDSLLQALRQRIEQERIYQLLPHYATPYFYDDCPPPTGGGPEWSFSAQFEGGAVSTGGENGPLQSCHAIAEWLKQAAGFAENPSRPE